MKLLILNGPRDPRAAAHPHYRGTYRAHPTYCEAVQADHEINKLFLWFLEEGGESDLVHDLTKASRYAELLNIHLSEFKPAFAHFEVIEVKDGDNPGNTEGRLMGFDLSAGYNDSLLWWWGLPTQPRPAASVGQTGNTSPSTSTFPKPILVLDDLIHRFYAPQLNRNGLFQSPDVASDCLRAMDALQRLSPNLYEGEELLSNFEVVGVHLVSPDGRIGSAAGCPGHKS
jgi:hypothetical protein